MQSFALLCSIWKPTRIFKLGGLLIGTWGKARVQSICTIYYNKVVASIEYAANGLILLSMNANHERKMHSCLVFFIEYTCVIEILYCMHIQSLA